MAAKQTEFSLPEKGLEGRMRNWNKTAGARTAPRGNYGCEADGIFSAEKGQGGRMRNRNKTAGARTAPRGNCGCEADGIFSA